MAHPDQGIDKFEDLAKLPVLFMGKDGYLTYFEWMKTNFKGFKDEQYKPYNFNPAPFIADVKSGQQGYLTSEPYEIEKQAGFKPKIFLLADNGYLPYSTMITTQAATVANKPEMVQRFVDASIGRDDARGRHVLRDDTRRRNHGDDDDRPLPACSCHR